MIWGPDEGESRVAVDGDRAILDEQQDFPVRTTDSEATHWGLGEGVETNCVE